MNTITNSITSTLGNPAQWLIDWIRGGSGSSGVSVNAITAMGCPPIAYACGKITGPISTLPLNLYKRDGRGVEMMRTHPAARLIQAEPNEHQNACEFRQTMMLHGLLKGNGRAVIIRRNGIPVELLILPPENTYTCFVDGKKWHLYMPEDDDQPVRHRRTPEVRDGVGAAYKFRDSDVLHVMGFSWNGLTGLSLIDVAKEALGIGIAAQRAVSKSFETGARPSIVIEVPQGKLRDPKEAAEFLKAFDSAHSGPDNQGRTAMMREGMTLKTIEMSASDAQWLEQRQFQRVDIAMLLGLEHIPGDDTSVSYNSLEQKNQAFVTNCLHPWLERWEQECNRKLLTPLEKPDYFFRFDTNEFMRPSANERAEYYSKMRAMRAMSANEVRAAEYLNPVDGLDSYENPAIDVSETSDDTPADRQDTESQAIESRMRHLIGVECNRVKDAARKQKNFVDWLDRFYAKWEARLANAIEDFGGDAKSAADHCARAHEELLEISGTVSPDGLADAVDEAINHWHVHAKTITDQITKELINV